MSNMTILLEAIKLFPYGKFPMNLQIYPPIANANEVQFNRVLWINWQKA